LTLGRRRLSLFPCCPLASRRAADAVACTTTRRPRPRVVCIMIIWRTTCRLAALRRVLYARLSLMGSACPSCLSRGTLSVFRSFALRRSALCCCRRSRRCCARCTSRRLGMRGLGRPSCRAVGLRGREGMERLPRWQNGQLQRHTACWHLYSCAPVAVLALRLWRTTGLAAGLVALTCLCHPVSKLLQRLFLGALKDVRARHALGGLARCGLQEVGQERLPDDEGWLRHLGLFRRRRALAGRLLCGLRVRHSICTGARAGSPRTSAHRLRAVGHAGPRRTGRGTARGTTVCTGALLRRTARRAPRGRAASLGPSICERSPSGAARRVVWGARAAGGARAGDSDHAAWLSCPSWAWRRQARPAPGPGGPRAARMGRGRWLARALARQTSWVARLVCPVPPVSRWPHRRQSGSSKAERA